MTDAGQSPMDAQHAAADADPFAQHPEIFVGAALLGGLVLAQVMKRLAADH